MAFNEEDMNNIVKTLLAPLDISIAVNKYCIWLMTIDKTRYVNADIVDIGSCCTYTNASDFFYYLLNCIDSFSTGIVNPYKGCKNIEEALVKRDLMMENNNDSAV